MFKVFAISNESGETFALKICHKIKSSNKALEQFENERIVLNKLKKLKKHDKGIQFILVNFCFNRAFNVFFCQLLMNFQFQ